MYENKFDDIAEEVLKANEEAHDKGAKWHTRSVPYQSRKKTRTYIWNLIEEQLRENNINPEGKKVLEVACGTGTFVLLSKKWQSASYDGVDISGEMIKLAKKECEDENTKFYKESLAEFSSKHKSEYDIIISSSFLHHLTDLDEGLKQISDMLVEGGGYIALHEVINHRSLTKLERFDAAYAYLMGYGGSISINVFKRLINFLKVLIVLYIRKNIVNENNESKFNLVDYQLNFDFNLANNNIVKKYGKIVPYCYYNFAELRFLKSINNHHMFIMKLEKKV